MDVKEYRHIVNYLKRLIEGSEFEGHVYSVGGCERDAYWGNEIKDIDLVVDLPEGGIRLAQYLEKEGYTRGAVVTYPNFSTAMFRLALFPQYELEVVHTRSECYRDSDSRNPETSFGSITEDCTRRDFTYNAIYYNVSKEERCYFNPQSLLDISGNILRTCGEPDIIFKEDPLRILRAIRFSCKYNSKIDDDTLYGMIANVKRLEIISKERIQDEMVKIMTGFNLDLAINLIYQIGAMPYIFPFFSRMPSTQVELLRAIKGLHEDHDLVLNLAVFMNFSLHPELDLKALKFSNDIIDACLDIIQNPCNAHILVHDPLENTEIRKFQYECKTYGNMTKHLMWMCATFNNKTIAPKTDFVRKRSKEMLLDGTAMFGYKLPVDGNDVMEVKSIVPSAKVKKYLNMLLVYAFVNPKITREECINILKAN